jgi:hypothetical protein
MQLWWTVLYARQHGRKGKESTSGESFAFVEKQLSHRPAFATLLDYDMQSVAIRRVLFHEARR